VPSAKPSLFSAGTSARSERHLHPGRSNSTSRAPERAFQASVLTFSPLQFKYRTGESRAALAKHPNATQPLWERDMNAPLGEGRARPAPRTNEHHFASPPPPRKIEPLRSEPHPREKGAAQGLREEEAESSARREEGFGSPSLVPSYASSQHPPDRPGAVPSAAAAPAPPGRAASTAALINAANLLLPLLLGPDRAT